MSQVWNEIVEMVDRDYYNEVTECIVSYSNGIHLSHAIHDFLMAHVNVVHVSVTNVDAFESPGYDTGVVFAAWTEKDGSLHTIDYQWELRQES